MSSEADAAAPTAKDAIFFQTILCSMKNKPEVDWALVAEKTGYKDAKSANTRYGQIIKKLTGLTAGQAMTGATATTTPVKATPVKATPKKGKVVKKAAGSGTNTTPAKVTKRAPKKAKKSDAKVEVFEDEGDDETEPATEEARLEPIDHGDENETPEEEEIADTEEGA